jgi:hypothetical protein
MITLFLRKERMRELTQEELYHREEKERAYKA